MKLNYDNKALKFQATDLHEALLISECFEAEEVAENDLTWHHLLTREPEGIVSKLKATDSLRLWGLQDDSGVEIVQNVLNSKLKKYRRSIKPLEEIKNTPQFARAKKLVLERYGGPLKDGRQLFPYQIDTAAYMIATKRLLIALEMGLGSATRSAIIA